MSREFLVCKNYRCIDCRSEGETYGYIQGDNFLMDTFDLALKIRRDTRILTEVWALH